MCKDLNSDLSDKIWKAGALRSTAGGVVGTGNTQGLFAGSEPWVQQDTLSQDEVDRPDVDLWPPPCTQASAWTCANTLHPRIHMLELLCDLAGYRCTGNAVTSQRPCSVQNTDSGQVSTDKQIKRRNGIMSESVVIRRDVTDVTLSEMTQAQNDKHYVTSLICCDLYTITK